MYIHAVSVWMLVGILVVVAVVLISLVVTVLVIVSILWKRYNNNIILLSTSYCMDIVMHAVIMEMCC